MMPGATVLAEVEVEPAPVPSASHEHENEAEYWDHQHIEDTKEDEAAGDPDAVAAIAESERDGVQQPQEVRPPRQDDEVASNAKACRLLTALIHRAHR